MTLHEQIQQAAQAKASDRQHMRISVPLPILLSLIDGVRPDQAVIDARKMLGARPANALAQRTGAEGDRSGAAMGSTSSEKNNGC